MIRKMLIAIIIIFSLGSLVLISHVSKGAAILSRYSVRYFIFLLIYHLGFALIVISYFYSDRITAWMQRNRLRLAEFSFADFIKENSNILFIEKHYNKLFLVILLVHIIGVLIYFPPQKIFNNQPILQTDYANHFHQVSSVVETLDETGKHWAYDPSFTAGYPLGTLFDVDMKFFEIVVFILTKLGINLISAYNILIVTLFMAIPLILYSACKNFKFSRVSSLFIILSGILLWHSDATIFLFSTAGMVSFVFGVYWALLCVSLFYRYLCSGRLVNFLYLLIALSIGLMIHILMPVLLVVPLGVLYILFFKKIKAGSHFLILLSIPIVLIVNSWWISTILRFFQYRIISSWWATQSISEFLRSLPEMATNIGDILFILGLWGFYMLFSKNKELSLAGISSVIWFYFLGKLGSNLPFFKSLEPARFLIPANIVAMMGIMLGAKDLLSQVKFQQINLRKAFPILILPVLVLLQISIPYYWFVGPCYFCEPSGFNEQLLPVETWLNENTTKEARIAFSDESPDTSYTGARLKYAVDREFIGGPFSDMNLEHNYATFTPNRFFTRDISDLTVDEFMYYTDLFNIKWVVTADDMVSKTIASFAPYVTKVEAFEGRRTFTIYEVNRQPNYFLEGSGTVTAELNKITVQNAGSSETILKYHWLETLAVSPEMPIEKVEVDGSPIGFIKVTNGDTRDFIIYNSYETNPAVTRTPYDKIGQYLDIFGLSYNH